MVIVGIDPGLRGGVCVCDTASRRTWVHRVPLIRVKGQKDQFDPLAMSALIPAQAQVWIELVGARPGQGVVSMFRFGYGAGLWAGICAGKGISPILIRPQEWKSKFDLSSDKQASRDLASKVAPGLADRWKLKRDEGLAEALLLVHYAKTVSQVGFTRYLRGAS